MARLVLRLSALARAAALAAMIGAGLTIYGRQKGIAWADRSGFYLLLGSAAVYLVERIRESRKSR